jgi:hypothetical protein
MSILFFILAVCCYAITQLQMHGKLKFKGMFWSKESWTLKYKWKSVPNMFAPDTWYYRTFEIPYKERFPGSATIFVSLTDGYHLVQMFMKILLCLCIVTYRDYFGWYDAIGYWILFGIFFTLTYKLFAIKTKP